MKTARNWLASSLLLLSAFSLVGCLGPKLAICVSDPEMGGFQCHNQKNNEDYFLRYQDIGVSPTPNYIAMPARDYEKLLTYIQNKCK